jgi:hypothetical protein
MANPFKDAEKRKKVAPGGSNEKVEIKEEPVSVTDNPLEGMIEPKPDGKSYGFYLSAEAADKLEQLAKRNKCSKSKALDALLRSL